MVRSITKLNIQYAHRFLNYEGEAQYLHGHSGILTIEVEGDVDKRTGFVYPCNGIKKIAWDYLKCFDHGLIMQEEDPILPTILDTYKKQGILDGADTNITLGADFENSLGKSYPESRLVVVKKVSTCENLIELFYSLMKDQLNIKKMTFVSGDNCASAEF